MSDPQLGRSGAKLLRRELTVGQIARHLPEPHEVAAVVAQGRDDHVGPEPAAVLTDAPALSLVTPGQTSGLQDPLRQTVGHLLGRIEHREMPADDLVRLIALQPAGAPVPREHMPGLVEQEDRIVRLGLDQQPQVIGDVARWSGRLPLTSTAHTPTTLASTGAHDAASRARGGSPLRRSPRALRRCVSDVSASPLKGCSHRSGGMESPAPPSHAGRYLAAGLDETGFDTAQTSLRAARSRT